MACCCELQNTLDVEVTHDALLDVEIGGSAGVLLQAKSVDITENGTSVVAPDDGFDGLKSVEINTNVPKRFECGDATFAPPASGSTSISVMALLQKLNASCWDTSKVTTMDGTFRGCSSLQAIDVSGWDTSKVTNMTCMFDSCHSLQQLDVSGWDTSNVTSMYRLFEHCYALKYIDVSNWNTSKVKKMDRIFSFCHLFDMLDVSGWEASSCTSIAALFRECTAIRSIIGNKTLQDVEDGIVVLSGLKVSISMNDVKILRFSSILALANGLAYLTGQTAQTLTISSGSYNNMYNDDDTVPTADVIAERRARIAAICAAKNWNFAH